MRRRHRFVQSCLTLCNAIDCSLPGSSVHGIPQARVLERIAIPFSRGSSQPRESNLSLPHCRQIPYCLSHQGSPGMWEIIIYWWLCPFNATAWMQVTEPWRICWALVWRGSFLENFLSFVSCFPLPLFFEFPHPCVKHFWLLSCCWFEYLMQIILCICPRFTNWFYFGQKL